ncbi:hypothetical protein D082_19290 [Synechocystis sp. PCC 6714]|nr:hypothetical protein D082_19290 [Synechocystis sp. PCC 6714]
MALGEARHSLEKLVSTAFWQKPAYNIQSFVILAPICWGGVRFEKFFRWHEKINFFSFPVA